MSERDEALENAKVLEELDRVRRAVQWATPDVPPIIEGNILPFMREGKRWKLVVQDVEPHEDGGFHLEGRLLPPIEEDV